MLLKEKITYHANFDLGRSRYKKKTGEECWLSSWKLSNEKIQLKSTGEYFTLDKAVDQKTIFKDLTKLGNGKYGSRSAQYQAFKRIVKSHKLDWKLYDCSYSWQDLDDVLTLYVANINFDKRHAQTVSRTKRFDNTWTEAVGDLIAIRYEESEKQSQAIVYREEIDRKININIKNKSMHHVGELMKVENRKRAIKAKSLRDVVQATNHNAEVINETVDRVDVHAQAIVDVAETVNCAIDEIESHGDEIAMMRRMLEAQQAEIAALKAAAMIQIDL